MGCPILGRAPAFAVMLSLFLAGCQTTDFGQALESGSGTETAAATAGESKARVSWELYTPLYDQADHMKDLLAANELDKAATLFMEQKDVFAVDKAKHRILMDRLAEAVNAPKRADLKAALAKLRTAEWPAAEEEWPGIRGVLRQTEGALQRYADHDIFNEPAFRAAEAKDLDAALAGLKGRIEASAKAAFAAFDHFGTKAFFDVYPVEINRWSFLPDNMAALDSKLAAASTAQLKAFAANYPNSAVGDAAWERLGGLFVARRLEETGNAGGGDLVAMLGAVGAAKEAGFEPKKVPGLKVAFVEVTSKTLLAQGQIDFPATVDVDLPVDAVKADLDEALTNPTAEAAEFLIVFDVALAKASRRVTGITQQSSKVLVGTEKEPNPDYNIAQNEVNNARLKVSEAAMNAASTNAQYCYGMGCLGKSIGQIAAAAAQGKAREDLEAAMVRLSATPQYIDKPVYQPYKFDKARIHARKAMTVHYYVIDRNKGRYFKSTFDVSEEERFNVAYRIAEEDPDAAGHARAFDTEADVDDFEKAPSAVKLSQLIDHYLANKGRTRKLVSLAAIRDEMLKDKNTALAEFKANTFDARPLNDPRFDSVVVVYRGDGALGSGFFIKPDVVLTNWHVVEEFKFVEMKTYDGQETFGKVLGKDARLDLALIKAQRRGKPVHFYTRNTIDLGATVEAIGHPKRLEFSITRGVISAVRNHASISLPRGAGKEVLYVQTDAPINHGNSGGPLFLGDRVIGVNTWGANKNIAEGLNFAVHYSEVLAFLREHLPGFVVLK